VGAINGLRFGLKNHPCGGATSKGQLIFPAGQWARIKRYYATYWTFASSRLHLTLNSSVYNFSCNNLLLIQPNQYNSMKNLTAWRFYFIENDILIV
jgi:hypothetical protein